jgi:hypothetical protein
LERNKLANGFIDGKNQIVYKNLKALSEGSPCGLAVGFDYAKL